jgi:hypothetical protein
MSLFKENNLETEPEQTSSKHTKWRKKIIKSVQLFIMKEWLVFHF